MSSVIKWFQDYITGTVAQASENIRLNAVTVDGAFKNNASLVAVGAVALTPAQSGTKVYLSTTNAAAITLPSLATSAGVEYIFIAGPTAIATTAATIAAPAGKFQGSITCLSTGLVITAGTTLTFTTGTLLGDYARIWCDGTWWYVEGRSKVTTGSITIA